MDPAHPVHFISTQVSRPELNASAAPGSRAHHREDWGMESAGQIDNEGAARAARTQALAQRPSAAPLPSSSATFVDCQQFWQAALQYFELAQQFYTAGDYKLGDYCIARADAYVRLALLCQQGNTRGIAPLQDSPPKVDPAVGKPTLERLLAKFEEVRRMIYPHEPPVPPVAAEATNSPQCDGYWWTGWHHLDSALQAGAAGDVATADYYLHEAEGCLQAYMACEAAQHP
jgi:hypothetical protein